MSFNCSICNKEYKSYKSLWSHNKNIHPDLDIYISKKERNFSCKHCNKKFTRNDTLNYHIKNTCKNEQTNEINELKKQVVELQKKISESKTTNNINNGTINKTVNNIIYINKIGTENYLELNDEETSEIFSKEISGVVSLIKYISCICRHFNERLPSNHSFCSSSLEGKYLLTFNSEEAKVESTRKKYFYQELLSSAVTKMELLYNKCKKKFSKDKQTRIEDTIVRLKDIKERDFNDKILREIKIQLIQLSYNCRNTVLNTWDNNKLMANINSNHYDSDLSEDDYDSDLSEKFILPIYNKQ